MDIFDFDPARRLRISYFSPAVNIENFRLGIIGAALSATVSYLFYYKTIAKAETAKASIKHYIYRMGDIFSAVLLKNTDILNPLTLLCSVTA